MALTSTSTLADAIAQYRDNLLWEGDVTKARAALEAARFLLLSRGTRIAYSDGSAIDYESLQGTVAAITAYLNTHDTTNRPSTSFVRARPLV